MASYVTLLSLRNRARQDADMERHALVTDSELNQYINDAIAELMDLLIAQESHPWESRRVALYVPKGYPAIWLPCDFYSLVSVSYMPGGIYGESIRFEPVLDGPNGVEVGTSLVGEYRTKVPMRPFMEFEREYLRREIWTAECPPRYRLTCFQPRPEVVATADDLASARGYTYMSDLYETFPAEPQDEEFDGWMNSCTLAALETVLDPATEDVLVARYVPPPAPLRLFGFVLEFDRAPQEESLLKVHYHPKGSELSADADVFIDYNGWAAFISVCAAIRMRTKEESDTSDLRARKAELAIRIATAAKNRDTGQPQTVVDVTGATYPWNTGFGNESV